MKDSKWVVTKKSTDNIGDETITFKSTNLDKEYNKTNKITNLEDLEQYYTKIYDMVYQAGGRKSRLTRNKRTKSKRIRKSRKVRSKRIRKSRKIRSKRKSRH